MGTDPVSRKNYDHRKEWLIEHLERLTPAFSVSIQTYAIMSNHFHLVVYYDPLACQEWSPTEVAERWYRAHPTQIANRTDEESRLAIELLASNPERVKHCRQSLGSLSEFMKALKQPIAYRANQESKTDGHFWSNRFYSGAILSEEALLTVMAYVDLNPVRAKMARRIEDSINTGLYQRVRAAETDQNELNKYLTPCFDGLHHRAHIIAQPLRLYRRFVEELLIVEQSISAHTSAFRNHTPLTKEEIWQVGKSALSSKPRAIGRLESVLRWLEARGFSARESTLPDQLA